MPLPPSGKVLVEIDPRYFADRGRVLSWRCAKANNKLGWRHRVTFDELVRDMLHADLAAIRVEHKRHGRVE